MERCSRSMRTLLAPAGTSGSSTSTIPTMGSTRCYTQPPMSNIQRFPQMGGGWRTHRTSRGATRRAVPGAWPARESRRRGQRAGVGQGRRELFFVSLASRLNSRHDGVPSKPPRLDFSQRHQALRTDGLAQAITRGYDVTRDGQRFLMVQNLQPPPPPPSRLVLVSNWPNEPTAACREVGDDYASGAGASIVESPEDGEPMLAMA